MRYVITDELWAAMAPWWPGPSRAGASAAAVAGSRFGLPDTLKAPPGAANLWKTFAEAMKKAKAQPAAFVAT